MSADFYHFYVLSCSDSWLRKIYGGQLLRLSPVRHRARSKTGSSWLVIVMKINNDELLQYVIKLRNTTTATDPVSGKKVCTGNNVPQCVIAKAVFAIITKALFASV